MSKFVSKTLTLHKDAWAILNYLKFINKDENARITLTKALLLMDFIKSELRTGSRLFIRTPDGLEKEITL